MERGNFNYGAFLDDKTRVICRDLGKFPPSAIFRCPEGIYVFSSNVAKVHSTIVVAGVGQAFQSITDWFRSQISAFSLQWSGKDPEGRVEIKMLTPIFYTNLSATHDIVFADLLVIEVASRERDDYVARIDFAGNIFDLSRGVVILAGYKSMKSRNDIERNSFDEEERDLEAQEKIEREAAEEDARILRKEFEALGIALPDDMSDPQKIAALFASMKEKYPGKRCFLERKNVTKKRFNWVYREF
jgi:hypothetical protein